jgi:hypothetical protein
MQDETVETLQRPFTDRLDLMHAPAPRQRTDELCTQDLTTSRIRTHPRRLHDRGPEHVTLLDRHVTRGEADANRDGVGRASGATAGASTPRSRTPRMPTRTRRERRPQSLDPPAAQRLDGIVEDPVVMLAQLIRARVTEPAPLLRRTDQIGDHPEPPLLPTP